MESKGRHGTPPQIKVTHAGATVDFTPATADWYDVEVACEAALLHAGRLAEDQVEYVDADLVYALQTTGLLHMASTWYYTRSQRDFDTPGDVQVEYVGPPMPKPEWTWEEDD